jgi:hypothetical protein
MTDLVTNIFIWGAVGIVLLAGTIMLFGYFLKLREAFLAGLRGLKLVEPEPKTPRWREAIDEWEERHPRFMWTMGCSAIVFLLAAAAWGEYDTHRANIKQLAVDALLIVLLLLSAPPWWFWLALGGAIGWVWAYRRNSQRQEAILELLLEIRGKLE